MKACVINDFAMICNLGSAPDTILGALDSGCYGPMPGMMGSGRSVTRREPHSGDIILAGYGETADAYHTTTPEPEGIQAVRAMQLAMDMAGVSPPDIDYVNLHGTVTDTDVDGMHIRLPLLTFFIQYFPDLIRESHLFILQTPLFRVRNKQKTLYCYSEAERDQAVKQLGRNPEITRFKGLGEISTSEFKNFIGEDIRLEEVTLENAHNLKDILRFYMGDNTDDRRQYIVDNLRIEEDLA